MKILHVAGARPNFVKIASIIKACQHTSTIDSVLVDPGKSRFAKEYCRIHLPEDRRIENT